MLTEGMVMLNPVTLAFRYQQMGVITSWKLSHQAIAAFLDLAEGVTTRHPTAKFRKTAENRRPKRAIVRGADLKDRYGRRTRDVDVENI